MPEFRRSKLHSVDSFDVELDEKCAGKTERFMLLSLVLLRILNVSAVCTSFVPDEYWQSLEVAHNSVFGFGYLTWEWKYGLRSYAYPGVFAVAYKILYLLGMDNVAILFLMPRIMQAFMSALGDWYFFRFVKMHFGMDDAKFALLSCVTSWFWWYCATRTILNSLETSILCIGLFYYPWKCENAWSSRNVTTFQIIAIAVSVVRPTAAVLWVPLALWHISRARQFSVIFSYMLWSLLIVLFSSAIDRIYYGEWVLVHWNFFIFNVANNMGVHYGVHPWHWYLTQGLPVVLGSQIPFFALGAFSIFKRSTLPQIRTSKCLMILFFITVAVYSFLGHKEFRFILHLVPIACVFCGIGISRLPRRWQNLSVLFLFLTNVPIALYTGLIHQGGAVAVTKDLRLLLEKSCSPQCPGGVLYLMPCHTTPLYSHLHVNVSTRFLECPPNLHGETNYQDETSRFYRDPQSWLDSNVYVESSGRKNSQRYDWILMFDLLYDELKAYKPFEGFKICSTVFHTHFPEGKMGRSIYVLCRK